MSNDLQKKEWAAQRATNIAFGISCTKQRAVWTIVERIAADIDLFRSGSKLMQLFNSQIFITAQVNISPDIYRSSTARHSCYRFQ